MTTTPGKLMPKPIDHSLARAVEVNEAAAAPSPIIAVNVESARIASILNVVEQPNSTGASEDLSQM